MPRIKLTQKAVDKLKAPTQNGAPVIYWDTGLKGFGLLVSGKTATKTYIAQRDLPGGRTRRVSIASVQETSLAEARERAAKVLLDMRTGIDPKQQRRACANATMRVLESVRKHQAGLQSFRSMRRIEARRKNASALRLRFSQSLASLRQRLSQAKVRSTTQRRGSTTNPFVRSERLTISVSS